MATFAKHTEVNLFGTMHAAKHAAIQMQNNAGVEKGLILMVSST
jgi:NAD(P)-dependent dehydrogenase (short-subunit alcohol dehydrogenase family)